MKVCISLAVDYSVKDHERRKYVSEECETYIERSIRSLRVMFPMSGWLNELPRPKVRGFTPRSYNK